MITVKVYQNHAGQYVRLHCSGHAGYADRGEDIVCAGVSMLVINTLNALERLTDEAFAADTDPQQGLIEVRFHRPSGHDGKLLLDAMALGLQDIQNQYGAGYISLEFKEV